MTGVALVTGASSGIGEATARTLAGAGFTVYAGARRLERMAPLAEHGVRPVALDVTDDASMVSCTEQVLSEQGRIDVLVNNAGYGSYGAVEDVPLEEARRQVEVNVLGLARMCQLVAPHLRAQGSGTIVNVSSVGGRFSEPLGGWYHATKYAVEALSDSLRMELAPFGIRVVVVQPGAIASEWSGIAEETMRARSGGTAYADQVRGMARFHRASYGRGASGPDVVAEAILRAVRSGRPRPRYAAPRRYGVALAALRVVPDQVRDLAFRQVTRPRGARGD
jgi:NAD(P)-dependent dehydrogenase (short-subunit alcohol dehydrogenase family)